MSSSAAATVTNSTFSGVTGNNGLTPGAHSIQAYGQGQFTLQHSTVTDANADSAVAINETIDATISHSIISGNTTNADLSVENTASVNVDWSLLGTVSDTSTGAGYVEGTGVTVNVNDPVLAPLADNGGLTETHLPLAGSPVIDAGNPAITGAPTLDQRGLARISGAAIDIGAVEVAASVTPVTPTITDPTDVTVLSGATATFETTTTGTPTPTVTWEVSTDSGGSWQPITTDTAATVASDGLSVSVVTTDTHDGYLYRATATNSEGSETSDPATLTVTAAVTPVAPTITDPTDVETTSGSNKTPSNGPSLAATGSESPLVAALAGAIALLLGSGLISANAFARRRKILSRD